MSWNDEKNARLVLINNARAYLHNARGSADQDDGATVQEIAFSDRADIALRDWHRHLRAEKVGAASGLPAVVPASKPIGVSPTEHALARFAGRLDKIEALFEKIVEQEAARIASRDRFERAILAQLEPLKNAVTLLLSREPPSLAEKIQAAKAIQGAGPSQPTTEAKS